MIIPASEEQEQVMPLMSNNPDFNLYYISRLDKRHGKLLLKIIKITWPVFVEKYPGSSLHIVGEGDGLKRVCRAASKKHSNSVVFEGYAQDVSPHYKNADLVMGVGRVVIESLSYGIPVLAIKYNHLGPIITRNNFDEIGHSNFVAVNAPPPQTDVLLSTLNDFMNHRNYYWQEAVHLKKMIADRYDIRDTVKKTLSLYK